jgi:hypothetical protein
VIPARLGLTAASAPALIYGARSLLASVSVLTEMQVATMLGRGLVATPGHLGRGGRRVEERHAWHAWAPDSTVVPSLVVGSRTKTTAGPGVSNGIRGRAGEPGGSHRRALPRLSVSGARARRVCCRLSC